MKISLSEVSRKLDIIENNFLKKASKNPNNMVKYIKELMYTAAAFGIYSAKQEIKELEKKRKKKIFSELGISGIWVDLPIGDIAVAAKESKNILDRATEFWDQYALKVGSKLEKDKKEKLKAIFKKKNAEGFTGKSLEREIKKEFSDWSDRRINAIARTETTKEFNYARLETARENYRNSGIIRALRFHAIMDSNVTDTCQTRHGLVLAIDDPLVDRNTPPLHVKCRSIWEFVDKYDWEDIYKEKNSSKWYKKAVQETQPDITWGNPFAYGGKEDALVNYQNAYGIDKKLTEYTLNKDHPVGKHKARVFKSALGFDKNNFRVLERELKRNLAITAANKYKKEKTKHGIKYSVEEEIMGENKEIKKVLVVWHIDENSDAPRLVNAIVKEAKKNV